MLKTQREVESRLRSSKPGKWACGHGLYVQLARGSTQSTAGSWLFRYQRDGRSHCMGLGPVELLTLAEAREKALAYRRHLRLDKVDPLEAHRAAKARAA